MTGSPRDGIYNLTRVQQALGLSRTVVKGLIDAGFVTPQRGTATGKGKGKGSGGGRSHHYSFQDLMLLRTAHALQQAQVPPRKILGALTKLRNRLPAELPLTGLRISAVGNEIVVRDRQGPWAVDSGQLLMDFDVTPSGSSVVFMASGAVPTAADTPTAAAAAGDDAETWFARGEAVEACDRNAAEAAYRQALQIKPTHLHATLNLGALWCEDSRCDEASALYDAALAQGVASPLLHFNHAIALEDQQRLPQALASYERALALDPQLADAHYNAGRLHEHLGDARQALRHFSAYRRLKRAGQP